MIELIEDKKGENITVIDVREITTITEYMIIVTANSSVHARSLGRYIMDFFEEKNNKRLYKKSVDLNNPWVLIDASDIIVHIFLSELRSFYALEKLYFKGKIIRSVK